MRMSTCPMSTELHVACSRLSDSGEDAKVKTFFPCSKFTRQVLCSFLRAPMCGKSRKHSFNTEVIVDFSISRAWTPHAIFLSDRNDPLWECWYNLSNLTNQRVYQELVYRNGSFKEMITGSAASSPLSLISSRFTFVFVLSQFSRPNYLGAWDRLRELGKHTKRDEPPQKH